MLYISRGVVLVWFLNYLAEFLLAARVMFQTWRAHIVVQVALSEV